MKKFEKSIGQYIEISAALVLIVAPLIVFSVIWTIIYGDLRFKYDLSETTIRLLTAIYIFIVAGLEWKFLTYLSKKLE